MDPALLLVAGLAVILLLQFSRVRRQQREIKNTQSGIEVGAEVLTAAGMVATVVSEDAATVTLRSEDGHTSRWLRGAVVRVLADTDPASARHRPAVVTEDGPGTPPAGPQPGATDGLDGPRTQD